MNNAKLKITMHNGEVLIRGDRGGLLYLAKVCESVIGKTDPSGHWILMPEMENILKGSLKTRIEYDGDPE